jgi:hypothetical protein
MAPRRARPTRSVKNLVVSLRAARVRKRAALQIRGRTLTLNELGNIATACFALVRVCRRLAVIDL